MRSEQGELEHKRTRTQANENILQTPRISSLCVSGRYAPSVGALAPLMPWILRNLTDLLAIALSLGPSSEVAFVLLGILDSGGAGR